MNVLFPSEIDVSKIEYSDLRPFGDHAKIVYMSYDEKPIIIQTPLMKCPYGLGAFERDGEKTKYSLDLSFGGNSKSVTRLKTFLNEIDDKVLTDSTKKSMLWFKKKSQSRDVSQALYSPCVKTATENGEPTDKYPPTFKLKVPNYDGKFKVQCFNDEKKPLTDELPTLLTKGQSVRAIVKISGMWFAGGKFGITCELMQLRLTPRSQIKSYAFEDDSEVDEEGESSMNEDVESPINTGEQNYVLDSEDEL